MINEKPNSSVARKWKRRAREGLPKIVLNEDSISQFPHRDVEDNNVRFVVDNVEVVESQLSFLSKASGGWPKAITGAMSIIAWNCQGIEHPKVVQALCELCFKYRPSIVFLMESKNKKGYMESNAKLTISDSLENFIDTVIQLDGNNVLACNFPLWMPLS
ncbi:hypothetical protein GH714_002294 [Hevea brasiliensis]|uniref:Endonuclease/exonuclease/phosphatase domain-containing protein n=1 Tax=Hevea brasiliensis TaxID=3981 RepID=A0A6A6K5G3_HEVBR|nr:hypothetical protein GH714_002294 [Hevea brasiliensis]